MLAKLTVSSGLFELIGYSAQKAGAGQQSNQYTFRLCFQAPKPQIVDLFIQCLGVHSSLSLQFKCDGRAGSQQQYTYKHRRTISFDEFKTAGFG